MSYVNPNKRYQFSYEFHGYQWAFEVPASSEAEAKARLLKIADAKYNGEIVMQVGIATGPISGFLARLGL